MLNFSFQFVCVGDCHTECLCHCVLIHVWLRADVRKVACCSLLSYI